MRREDLNFVTTEGMNGGKLFSGFVAWVTLRVDEVVDVARGLRRDGATGWRGDDVTVETIKSVCIFLDGNPGRCVLAVRWKADVFRVTGEVHWRPLLLESDR